MLKLDRCLVQLLDKAGDERIVRGILSLGNQLGMQVIAEVVETDFQRDRLLALGCNLMQGYLFARSMPEAAMLAWLAQRTEPHTASPQWISEPET